MVAEHFPTCNELLAMFTTHKDEARPQETESTNSTKETKSASPAKNKGEPATSFHVLPQTATQWGRTLLLVVLTLFTTSLAVTISLLWNSAIQHALDQATWARNKSKFITASIITFIGILLTLLFVVVAAWAGVTLPGTALSTSAENVAG